MDNPINSLYLIRRLSLDWARSGLGKVLESNKTEQLRLSALNMTTSFPLQSDWQGAANGIFLLQEHYDLNVTNLASGIIEFEGSRAVSDHGLKAEELYQIGVSTINAVYYDTGIEWLELARQKEERMSGRVVPNFLLNSSSAGLFLVVGCGVALWRRR